MSTNGSTSSRSSNKPKFSTQVQDLLGAAKKVLNYEQEIVILDQILEEKKVLEGKLKSKATEVLAKDKVISSKDQEIASLRAAKSEEIAKLKSTKDGLFEEFQQRFKAWDTGTTKQEELAVEVARLTQELGQANGKASNFKSELTLLRRDLTECQDDLRGTEEKLKSVTKELNSKERELNGATTELDYLQEERTALGLEDLDYKELTARFDAFVHQCHELAKKFFLALLPEDISRDDLRAKLRSSGFAKLAPKNIPLSNTLQSQYLRMAAAEKIIAYHLYSNVFQQYYLPDSTPARQAMDEVLELLSQNSPREEAIFRLRLLSAYKNEQRDHVRSIATSTSSSVINILDPLLLPKFRGGFLSELNILFQEAFKLWAPVQRSAVTAVVENEPELDWNKHEDYDFATESDAGQVVHAPSNPLEPLFPRVSIGEEVICKGFALWTGQSMVVAAGIEFNQAGSPKLTHTRTNSGRSGIISVGSERRRLSSSSAASRSGETPTSPKNQSFVNHLNSRNMANP